MAEIDRNARIYVAGHLGLVGGAIVRALKKTGFKNLVLRPRAELDLMCRDSVDRFFRNERPEYVYLAAARVGGIYANNSFPAEFLYQNLTIQNHVIDAAYQHEVKKFAFLGSSCIYPKFADQPISEDSLLTGTLERTNEAYAVAKIAGIKLCEAYHRQYGFNAISIMPTNLYGPGDNFDLETSHVVPALIRKAHEAKVFDTSGFSVWGSGEPLRELLHVDDLADACLFLMDNYDDPELINVGCGEDISIRTLAGTVADVVGYTGDLKYDSSRPDGTPRKVLDVSRLFGLGWTPRIDLREGLEQTYEWYVSNGGALAAE
ncbi:GDP-L-fucose synthase [Alphaproteobacteria bacterium]|jgi:GDP-L-fucose synthase|nr:GDP-L-fucose synthase [Alphaproteobacteria bacterium]